jgi:hypothetical protein
VLFMVAVFARHTQQATGPLLVLLLVLLLGVAPRDGCWRH